MSERLSALLAQVRRLTPEERAEFLELVAPDLAQRLVTAWTDELDRRRLEATTRATPGRWPA